MRRALCLLALLSNMPTITITRTTPIYRSPQQTGVFVQWVVENPADIVLQTYTLERAGSPDGPFETVIANLDHFQFFDDLRDQPAPSTGSRENLNFLSLHRQVYYRVSVRAESGVTYTSVPTPIGDRLDRRNMLLRRKLQRDLSVGLQKFNGVPVSILKRRRWGTRCPACFDALTKSVTKPKCEVCYGTGYDGGYWDPVETHARFTVTAPQTTITSMGKVDITQMRLYLLDYPVLEPDDIIVHKYMNRRYLVKQLTQTELRTVPVHQVAIINELPRDSVEYRIPINADTTPIVY